MKLSHIILATLTACVMLTGCKSSYTDEYDTAYWNHISDPTAGDYSRSAASYTGSRSAASSNLEEPYDKGHGASSTTAVKSTFGSDPSQPQS